MKSRTHDATLEESAIIERVARIVFSVRGAKQDYTRLASELEQAVPFDIFGVVLLRYDRKAVRVMVCRRDANASWHTVHHQHPLSDSMVEQILLSPGLRVRDYPQGLDGPPSLSGDALTGYHQLHSTLIAPLMVEDRVLGTLELGSTALHTYAEESLQRLISAVVRVLATAIESVQLGGNAAIQDRQREALKDVASALTSRKDLSTVLEQIVASVSSVLSVPSCLFLLDRHKGLLHLEAQSGLDPEAVEQDLRHSISLQDDNIVSLSILRRQVVESHDLARDHHFVDNLILFTRFGLRSLYCCPLFSGSAIYGVLMIASGEAGGFTPLKTDILALFANQATVAIHNGLLSESLQQRSRFQEVVEQLELIHKQRVSFRNHGQEDARQHSFYSEELALLERAEKITQQTYGVSFSTVLTATTELLLTRDERDKQSVFATLHTTQPLSSAPNTADARPSSAEEAAGDIPLQEARKEPVADTIALLAQTSESALTRTAMLGELSRLILQLKQSTSWVKDAWFVVDLKGYCSYMNPAAESLCGLQLNPMPTALGNQIVPVEGTILPIEDVFTNLIPYMRNANEVCAYLQEFTRGITYRQEICCVLATYLIDNKSAWEYERNDPADSFRQDRHLQFVRYPLYTRQGEQFEAHALQVRDVTEQVRDEHNRSALLSLVSHDLRTPLTTIKAAVTGLLQSDVAWDEQDRHDMLEDINTEADHLTVLVNSLVELSRIEMGALHLTREWCDVTEIFHGVVENRIHPLLGERILAPSFSATLPLVYVDYVQIARVFYNLIENAIRHSPDGSTIRISADLLSEMPEKLRVQVIDQGPGIPAHERDRVFTSYSQKEYGNALELAICKGIVLAHLGSIWVESENMQGSCFVFTLPLHPHPTLAADESSSPRSTDSVLPERNASLQSEGQVGSDGRSGPHV